MCLWKKTNLSLKRHIIISAVLGIAIAFIIAGGMLTWGFKQSAIRSLDNYLTAFMNTLIASTSVNNDGNIIISPGISGIENLPQYWQISGSGKHLKKSKQLRTWLNITDSKHGEIESFNFQDSDDTNIYALKRTVRFPGDVTVTYMIGTSKDLADMFLKEQEKEFFLYLIVILTALALSLIILSFVQIGIVLRPLNRLRESITEIKKGNVSELKEPFPREIQPLVDELNILLSYNLKMIERYRTFSSNLSHALKTPLSILKNDAASSKDELAKIVIEKVENMNALINRYLSRVRIGGTATILGVRTSLLPILQKISNSFAKLYQKEITINCSEEIVLQIDEADLFELMGNVIENSCKYGHSKVEINITNHDGYIFIKISDDGKGIPSSMREEVLKRGVRLDETKAGSGIGIPIAVDIAKLYGGEIKLVDSALGGLEVIIILPITV